MMVFCRSFVIGREEVDWDLVDCAGGVGSFLVEGSRSFVGGCCCCCCCWFFEGVWSG